MAFFQTEAMTGQAAIVKVLCINSLRASSSNRFDMVGAESYAFGTLIATAWGDLLLADGFGDLDLESAESIIANGLSRDHRRYGAWRLPSNPAHP